VMISMWENLVGRGANGSSTAGPSDLAASALARSAIRGGWISSDDYVEPARPAGIASTPPCEHQRHCVGLPQPAPQQIRRIGCERFSEVDDRDAGLVIVVVIPGAAFEATFYGQYARIFPPCKASNEHRCRAFADERREIARRAWNESKPGRIDVS